MAVSTSSLCAVTVCLLLGQAVAQLPSSSFGQVQAQLRAQVDVAKFSTTYKTLAGSAAANAAGSAQYVQGDSNPALFTLPNQGMGSGIITLAACGLFAPHSHPRSNEVLITIEGSATIAFSEENQISINGSTFGGRVLTYSVPRGSSLVVPQGLIHYIANNASCAQTQVISVFDNKDPGTVSAIQQVFQFPDAVVAAATGLDLVTVGLVRKTSAGFQLVGFDKACQDACNGKAPAPSNMPSDILTATGTATWNTQPAAPVGPAASTAGR